MYIYNYFFPLFRIIWRLNHGMVLCYKSCGTAILDGSSDEPGDKETYNCRICSKYSV